MSDNLSLNMRVTANSSQGHRKYMEDCYKIRFQRDTQNPESDILFSYFGIFDGHGGKEASQYCKEKLYWKIIEQDEFWSDNDSLILNAIRNGFVQCHLDMWKELPNWNRTPSGLPSTSGTTATILFIKKNKAYCGHVGDSGLVIGYQRDSGSDAWQGKKLTRDHKPEDPIELKRIQNSGGSVMAKSGVNRVVWNRPVFTPGLKKSQSEIIPNLSQYELNYQRGIKNCPTEKIPFLAVARSLGDLWSYNVNSDEFIVSPVPDVFSFDLDPRIHKCLILATDGLWNVLKSTESVELVRQTDRDTEKLLSRSTSNSSTTRAQPFINPSQRLVNTAMQKCCEKMIRADNTSCITIMIDPPQNQHVDHDEINLDLNFENILKQNKTLEATKFNISDEFEYAEVDDDDGNLQEDEEEGGTEELTKTFSGQMLTSSTLSEFTTPLTSDKRSRSLVSLRRRHWSASHRSTNNNNNNYINTQDRERRNYNNNNLNISSISMVNKISKNLRKSFNDLYTNTNTNTNKNTEEGFKENNDNKYTKRFKMFKNRLIKTKNSLFSRKNVKSISSPNLKCLQQQQEEDKKRENYLNVTSSNQSFVNNMKLRFVNSSKRNQSKYLNSTAITTKMMSQTDLNRFCDGNHLDEEEHQQQYQQHTPSKRAKFY